MALSDSDDEPSKTASNRAEYDSEELSPLQSATEEDVAADGGADGADVQAVTNVRCSSEPEPSGRRQSKVQLQPRPRSAAHVRDSMVENESITQYHSDRSQSSPLQGHLTQSSLATSLSWHAVSWSDMLDEMAEEIDPSHINFFHFPGSWSEMGDDVTLPIASSSSSDTPVQDERRTKSEHIPLSYQKNSPPIQRKKKIGSLPNIQRMETPNLSQLEFAHLASLEEGDVGATFDEFTDSDIEAETGSSNSEQSLELIADDEEMGTTESWSDLSLIIEGITVRYSYETPRPYFILQLRKVPRARSAEFYRPPKKRRTAKKSASDGVLPNRFSEKYYKDCIKSSSSSSDATSTVSRAPSSATSISSAATSRLSAATSRLSAATSALSIATVSDLSITCRTDQSRQLSTCRPNSFDLSRSKELDACKSLPSQQHDWGAYSTFLTELEDGSTVQHLAVAADGGDYDPDDSDSSDESDEFKPPCWSEDWEKTTIPTQKPWRDGERSAKTNKKSSHRRKAQLQKSAYNKLRRDPPPPKYWRKPSRKYTFNFMDNSSLTIKGVGTTSSDKLLKSRYNKQLTYLPVLPPILADRPCPDNSAISRQPPSPAADIYKGCFPLQRNLLLHTYLYEGMCKHLPTVPAVQEMAGSQISLRIKPSYDTVVALRRKSGQGHLPAICRRYKGRNTDEDPRIEHHQRVCRYQAIESMLKRRETSMTEEATRQHVKKMLTPVQSFAAANKRTLGHRDYFSFNSATVRLQPMNRRQLQPLTNHSKQVNKLQNRLSIQQTAGVDFRDCRVRQLPLTGKSARGPVSRHNASQLRNIKGEEKTTPINCSHELAVITRMRKGEGRQTCQE